MSTQITPNEIEATNEELKEILVDEGKVADQKKESKHVMSRIFALLMAVAPIVVCCIFRFSVIYLGEASAFVIDNEKSLLSVVLALFGFNGSVSDLYTSVAGAAATAPADKLFGFLPMIAGVEKAGGITSLILYFILLVMAVTVILAIVALFCGKKAPAIVRFITGLNFITYYGYMLWMLYIATIANISYEGDIIIYGIAIISFLVFFIFSAIKSKLHIFLGTLNFIFTCLFTSAVALIYIAMDATVAEKLAAEGTNGLIALIGTAAILGITGICFVIGLVGLSVKKVYGADIVRTVLMLLVGGFLVATAMLDEAFTDIILFAEIATAAAVLQLIVQIIAVSVNRKIDKKKAAKAAEEAAEAVEDDGATLAVEEPVEEIVEEEIIEEEEIVYSEPETAVAPVAEPAPAPAAAATADYDYYNSKSFDPFVASLSSEERAQFTELFILRYKGEMANIPEYKVGGDNREFFNKIFINLGSIRARLSNELIEKMYQFAIRM